MLLFDLPVRGSWLLLLCAVSLFLVGALGTGLLVSTLVDSQALAFLIGLLISLLPTFVLSGFIFPIASMPVPIQVDHLHRAGAVLPGRPARASC